MSQRITAGFIPLVDCAPLVVAARRGFAEAEGLDLVLLRETSWASIRDRMAVGHFDAAHMLAPMALAANLGLQPLSAPVMVPIALGLGGNAITVSNGLWREMAEQGADPGIDAASSVKALSRALVARGGKGQTKPVIAIVHQHSAHNYELRYWLAAGGIDPDRDVTLVALPPPLMADALATGQIDGFCVGEPWSSVTVARGAGRIVTTKSKIWRSGPDKVVGVRAAWAAAHADTLAALVRAVARAARWCDEPDNHADLATLLASADVLAQPAEVILPSLTGQLRLGGGAASEAPDFLMFARHAANVPWQSHALWFLAQMARWGDVELTEQVITTARRTYRPDIYRSALAGTDLTMAADREPTLSAATFFDGRRFDPDDIDGYLDTLEPPRL